MYSRVYVEITNVCNKNCSFCPGTKRKPSFMNFDDFCIILDKLTGITKYLYFHIMGEPLLHPELPLFIKTATEKGFKVAITTNGTLLKNIGEQIVSAGVYKVNISLHSFEDTANEEYLTYINNCINFADFASKNNVLTIFRLWNNGYQQKLNQKTELLLKSYFKEEWHHGNRGARIRNKLHLEYGDRFIWPDINANIIDKNVFCYGLKDHFGILCDGRVVPCCLDREGDITLGNILRDNIYDIIKGNRACSIREGFSNRKATEELCKKCSYAKRFK